MAIFNCQNIPNTLPKCFIYFEEPFKMEKVKQKFRNVLEMILIIMFVKFYGNSAVRRFRQPPWQHPAAYPVYKYSFGRGHPNENFLRTLL